MSTSKRILIVGTSGSGKTTLAKEIANILGLPHVAFDSYRHRPKWLETPDPVFQQKLLRALAGESWVADGNYSIARDIVWPRTTILVWLDYSIFTVLWRLFQRTLRRGIFREELWNGNKENIWIHFFTHDSLFIWALQTHWRRRLTIPADLQQPEYSHIKVVHLKSGSCTRKWVTTLKLSFCVI